MQPGTLSFSDLATTTRRHECCKPRRGRGEPAHQPATRPMGKIPEFKFCAAKVEPAGEVLAAAE